MVSRFFLLFGVVAATGLSGCSLDELLSDDGPPPEVVYVQEPVRPVVFDPYYNQPKVYVQSRPYYYAPPERYYETQRKKTKGNKVYKTTTVKNQYGDTVYKHTSTSKKKKKK